MPYHLHALNKPPSYKPPRAFLMRVLLYSISRKLHDRDPRDARHKLPGREPRWRAAMDPHLFDLLQVIVAAGDTTTGRPAREGGDGWWCGISWAGIKGVAAVIEFPACPGTFSEGGCCVRLWLGGRMGEVRSMTPHLDGLRTASSGRLCLPSAAGRC